MPETLPLKPIDVDTVDKLAATVAERSAIADSSATSSTADCATCTSWAPAARSSAATPPTTCSSRRPPSRLPAAERRAQHLGPRAHG